MQLRVERAEGSAAAVVFVQGSLDGSNYQQLIELGQTLYADGVRKLVLELSECAYMSSAGLVALNTLTKLVHGEPLPNTENGWAAIKAVETESSMTGKPLIALVNPTTRVDRVLDLAGLKGALPIYSDTAAALAAL